MIARGEVAVPGDKSITHRALLLAALSDGRCALRGALAAGDTRATAACLRILGVRVGPLGEGRTLRVEGRGLRPFRAPRRHLDCRNSGTTARLLMGLLSAHAFESTLAGDASLRRRPMRRVADPLTQMGATIRLSAGGCLPATIRGGSLKPLSYDSPVASAQVKTTLFFAGLAGGVRVTVREPVASRDHGERLLRVLGARVRIEGTTVTVEPVERIPAFDGDIPGDISSAAFLLAAGVLAEGGELAVRGVGVNPTRTGFLRALARMGAPIEQRDRWLSLGEEAATLVARPAALAAIEVTPEDVPSLVDEIPMLACLAARSQGTSVFRGVGELRVKESDRLGLIRHNLAALGVRAEAEGDTLWVEGAQTPPRGRVRTAGDHRLAMAFAVLGTVRGAHVAIDDRRCVAVSYPHFFRDLTRVLTRG
jgi:3-phosphoshikimate 1-carboxyvinyltransferase